MTYALIVFPFKDPDEVLDYDVDWSARLGADTITTSTWLLSPDNVDTALVVSSNSSTAAGTKVWLSGGTVGVTYSLTNRIATAGGRTMDQSCQIKIKSK